MTGQNKLFDDVSKLMTNAMGVAQGAKSEAQNSIKGWIDRWMAERDFVTREEFDAVRAMAVKAREENDALAARLAALDGTSGKPVAQKASPAKALGAKSAGEKSGTAKKVGATVKPARSPSAAGSSKPATSKAILKAAPSRAATDKA